MTAHKLPAQLSRLVKRLAVRGHSVLIHVDKKAKQSSFEEMLGDLVGNGTAQFMSSRQTCYWGGFGVVQAGIDGLRMAVQLNTDCDFVFLMTGQCYPLISMAAIEAQLQAIGEQSVISCTPMPIPWWPNGGMDFLQDWHFHIGSRLIVSPTDGSSLKRKLLNRILRRRPLPVGLQPFYGGFVLDYAQKCRRLCAEFPSFAPGCRKVIYKYSFIPDELFFSTIIGNSDLPIINDLPYYVHFQPHNTGHPDILTAADCPTLIQSNKIFDRKFDETVDESILTLLDTHALEQ